MRETIHVNLNDRVRVRLNELGHQLHRKDYDETLARHGFEYRPPVEDEDGWSEWQLWDLMSRFGPAIWLGCQVPFENCEIVIQRTLPM